MKKPEEIKKGLNICSNSSSCRWCPYQVFVESSFGCEEQCCDDGLLPDALAYIQQLEAKVAMLEQVRATQATSITTMQDALFKQQIHQSRLLEERSHLEAERDAAVADVKSLCATNYFSGDFCAYCKHNEPDGQCHHPCQPYSNKWGWEWRGVQKEETK